MWRLLLTGAVMAAVCVGEQLYLGDDCELAGGGPGVCKREQRCAAAAQGGLRTCFTENGLPVVCCPRAAPNRKPASPGTATPPGMATPTRVSKKPPVHSRRIGEVSEQKCREFGRAVYVEVDTAGFPFASQTTKKADCAQISQQLIVGGTKCKPKEFPHMALLGFGSEGSEEWLCGGSLISDRYILTAAHCLFSRSAGRVRWALLGDLNAFSELDEARPLRAQVDKVQAAPGYQHRAHYHDIALLRLLRRVEFNAFVRPACLHTDVTDAMKAVVTATGWGVVEWSNEQLSQDLMKVDLQIQPASRCNATYWPLKEVGTKLVRGFTTESMICAGDTENHRDTCVGDSGGPLQLPLTDPFCMYSVVGVTAFGSKVCGVANSPAVYTRVAHYLAWIESVVWPTGNL